MSDTEKKKDEHMGFMVFCLFASAVGLGIWARDFGASLFWFFGFIVTMASIEDVVNKLRGERREDAPK